MYQLLPSGFFMSGHHEPHQTLILRNRCANPLCPQCQAAFGCTGGADCRKHSWVWLERSDPAV